MHNRAKDFRSLRILLNEQGPFVEPPGNAYSLGIKEISLQLATHIRKFCRSRQLKISFLRNQAFILCLVLMRLRNYCVIKQCVYSNGVLASQGKGRVVPNAFREDKFAAKQSLIDLPPYEPVFFRSSNVSHANKRSTQ